jgi:excisionase family DNA binding protein
MAKKTLTNKALNGAHGIGNPLAKRLFSVREAAEYLGRSVWGIRELVWSQSIPIVKQDGCRKIYFDVHDLDSFIDRNKAIYN